jgi:hypothetical protein
MNTGAAANRQAVSEWLLSLTPESFDGSILKTLIRNNPLACSAGGNRDLKRIKYGHRISTGVRYGE